MLGVHDLGKNAGERSWQQAFSGILDDKREDFTSFVNDLARILQTCIDTCIKDEQFDTWIEEDNVDYDTALSRSIRKSLFLLPFRITSAQKAGLIGHHTSIVFKGAIRLLAASGAVYALHYVWNNSILLSQWHETLFGRNEDSPEWLIEHEREIEMAKKSKQRKNSSKKSKRKGSSKKQFCKPQPIKLIANTPKRNSKTPHLEMSTKDNESTAADDSPMHERQRDDDSNDHWEHHYSQKNYAINSNTEHHHRDRYDFANDNFGGVPSSISISTSSYTVSNNDQSEETLGEPTPSSTVSRRFNISNSPPRKPLLVPTEQQRNEAAERLREYQNAQIQRLMYQKKLYQGLKGSSAFQVISTNEVKPPPGFSPAIESEYNNDIQDDVFFADNELLLSKLLDEEDDVNDNISTDSGVVAFAQESSLDPSATPFVVEGFNGENVDVDRKPNDNNCYSKWNIKCSPAPSLNGVPHAAIKGVYGGNVW